MEQGTPEWHQIRLGKVTASRVKDVIAKTKTGYGAGRANYMAQLLCERLTGQPTQGFSNDAMRHGTEIEPLARVAWELKTGIEVDQIAFVDHPNIPMAGASPDGLILDNGLIEIKCPNTATHLETLLTKKVSSDYITQMQWQMACTGRTYCEFVSFDNRLPEHLQLFIKTIGRDDEFIKTLESEVILFIQELNEKINQLGKINV
jgi:putative phage-type endonuclease